MPHLSEPAYAVSLASLAVLCVLGLRRLVMMQGLHALRVVLFTALLWAVALYLFVLACPQIFATGCEVSGGQPVGAYTCSEM